MPTERTLSAAPDASGSGAAPTPAAKPATLPEVPKLMAGKRGLIMGVANDRSIAWGIARVLHGQGAELAFSYQGGAFGRRAVPLAGEFVALGSRNHPDVDDDVGHQIAARLVDSASRA